jgi:xenotropic and polytropic retrovirus receptor 1
MQNIRRYGDTQQRWPHLGNAVKYALSHVVVIFGVFHPTATSAENTYDRAWLIAYLVSTIYSFWWDVVMDWGLLRNVWHQILCCCFFYWRSSSSSNSRRRRGSSVLSVSLAKPRDSLRARMMYPSTTVYVLAIVLDFLGRFVWTLTLIPSMTHGPFRNSHFIMSLRNYLGLVEILRRTLWSFFRVENEHLNNTYGYRRVQHIPMHFDSTVRKPNKVNRTPFVLVIGELAVLFAVVLIFTYISYVSRRGI